MDWASSQISVFAPAIPRAEVSETTTERLCWCRASSLVTGIFKGLTRLYKPTSPLQAAALRQREKRLRKCFCVIDSQKNLVCFLYQWVYQYRCADQQTRLSLRKRQDTNCLPSACLQYDFVFPMVLIWSWVIVIHQCPLSVQGFRAILIWRDWLQGIWSLKVLLWLWLLQVYQELESWFGNGIRYIVSDINLQQKGGKTKPNQGRLLDPNISQHLQMFPKEQHKHQISSERGNGGHRGNRGFTTQLHIGKAAPEQIHPGTITFTSTS